MWELRATPLPPATLTAAAALLEVKERTNKERKPPSPGERPSLMLQHQ